MDSDQWRRVEGVLDTVLEHDPQEWPEVVARACGVDEALRRNVEDLLGGYTSAQRFLTKPPATAAAALLNEHQALDESDRFEGRRIGAYRLVREIGGGGMARVFLAERADGQFRQEVALKLLRPGFDADIEQWRFLAERQILASLHHPNIARLLDGGLTDEGLPYLALEYIEGQPIDAYCDERKLPVRDRLKLFLAVTEATQYAHRNLIVHRDLKPSNILVTSDGQVKLLDFGIAKLLQPEAHAVTVPRTRQDHHWMTPEYAAPEQIRGDPVSTATDVYQLGVVLYQLLGGRLPFQSNGGRLGQDFEHAVLHSEPTAPSATILGPRFRPDRDGAPSADISLARGTGPDQLRRALRGDLDAIVMRALRKEPDDRYASAQELAEDIRRYLLGHAVLARGQAIGYKVRRFARRHRWALSAAAAFVLLLGTYAVTVTAQARQIRRALDGARTEARKAEQVTGFVLGLFEASDPAEALGDTITARALLERGVTRARLLDGQPLVQAQMLDLVGRIRTELGAYTQAEPVLEQALATRRRTLGNENPDVAETMHHLGNLTCLSGNHKRAASLHREALALRRAAFGERHPKTLESLFALARAMHEGGDHAAGKELFEEWITVQSSSPAVESADHANQLDVLGSILAVGGDLEDLDRAETLLRRALAIRRSNYGAKHPKVAVSLTSLATVLAGKGEFQAAEGLLQKSLAVRRSIYPSDHPEVAASLLDLAAIVPLDRIDEAEATIREALAILRRSFDEDSPQVTSAIQELAHVLHESGKYAEAEPLFRDQLRRSSEEFGDDHPVTMHFRLYLADVLRALGEFEEAEPLLLASYEAFRETASEYRAKRAVFALESLAKLYEATGRTQLAAKYRALLARQ